MELGWHRSKLLDKIIESLPADASTEVFTCPHCGQSFAATSSESKMHPEEGDPSICMWCGEFMCWHDGAMRVCTEEELAKLNANSFAKTVSDDIKRFNRIRDN